MKGDNGMFITAFMYYVLCISISVRVIKVLGFGKRNIKMLIWHMHIAYCMVCNSCKS